MRYPRLWRKKRWTKRKRCLEERMQKVTRIVDTILSWFLVALMVAMVATVSWQVATRYVLNSPSSYTEELASYLLIWISLLGAAYALRVRAHLGIDILVRRFQARRRRAARIFSYGTIIVFSLVALIFGGGWLVYVTLDLNQLSAAFQLPIGYVYTVIPLSGLITIYYSVVALLELRQESKETPDNEDGQYPRIIA